MTNNDSGHLNNLDKSQLEALKSCWILLIDIIRKEGSLSVDQIISSIEGDELFRLFAYDNPDGVLLRWLRARKWNVNDAVIQLIDTLKWRKEWGIKHLLAKGENELLIEEILTGKGYFMGRDKLGRPINYVHLKNHIKDQFPDRETKKLTILAIETCRKLLDESIETGTVIIDLNAFGMKNVDYQLVKFFINLLENYYPESLGLALIVNAPLLFYSSWNLIKHSLDPIVKSKIHFIKNTTELAKYIDPNVLPKQLNGNQPDFKYIPPTDQDQTMLAAFRDDKQGKKLVRTDHRTAARHYLNITFKWAHDDEQNQSLLKQRIEARKQLRDSYEQLVPYINTRTHYHRIGLINEPIFDIAYQKLRSTNQSKIVKF